MDIAREGGESGGSTPGAGAGNSMRPDGQHSGMQSRVVADNASKHSSGSSSRKRVRTSTVLEDVDKKFLLEQYVAERQNSSSLQLQSKVGQLEKQLEDVEKSIVDKERIHNETLALAEETYRGNLLVEVSRLMECELSCSICNEVFIEPAVLSCGHTYCSYCINRALLHDYLCPICRGSNGFNVPAKNIEMRNFISKIFQMMPNDIKTSRDQVVQERAAIPVPTPTDLETTRRRRRRSASPFDLLFEDLGFNNYLRDFRRSPISPTRSRSVSTISDSDSSEDARMFDVRTYRSSPSPPPRARPRSTETITDRSSARPLSPSPVRRRFRDFSPFLWSPHHPRLSGRTSSSNAFTHSRSARSGQNVDERPDRDYRPRNMARRGRPFNGRSSTTNSPFSRRWGPRRTTAGPTNDGTPGTSVTAIEGPIFHTPRQQSSSVPGRDGLSSRSSNRSRQSFPVVSNVRSLAVELPVLRGNAYETPQATPSNNTNTDRTSGLSSDNYPRLFENLFNWREPNPERERPRRTGFSGSQSPLNLSSIFAPRPSSNSSNRREGNLPSSSSAEVASTSTPGAQPFQHDHSYTSRPRDRNQRNASSPSIVLSVNEATGAISTLRDPSATPPSSTVSNPVLGPPSSSTVQGRGRSGRPRRIENTDDNSSVETLTESSQEGGSSTTPAVEPRRSPRIAQQLNHREPSVERNFSIFSRRGEQRRTRESGERPRSRSTSTRRQRGRTSRSTQSQRRPQPASRNEDTNDQQNADNTSTISSTGGTRGSSIGEDSPALPTNRQDLNERLIVLRRFVDNLNNMGRLRELNEANRTNSTSAATLGSTSAHSRQDRRSSVEMLTDDEIDDNSEVSLTDFW